MGATTLEYQDKAKTKSLIGVPAYTLTAQQQAELDLFLQGGYQPLTGYLDATQLQQVCQHRTLGKLPFFQPFALIVTEQTRRKLAESSECALQDQEGVTLALLRIEKQVRLPGSLQHLSKPLENGLSHMTSQQSLWLLSGPLTAVTPPCYYDFQSYRQMPAKPGIAVITHALIHRQQIEFLAHTSQQYQLPLCIQTNCVDSHDNMPSSFTRLRSYEKTLSHLLADSQLHILPSTECLTDLDPLLSAIQMAQNFGHSHFTIDPNMWHSTQAFNDIEQKVLLLLSAFDIKYIPFAPRLNAFDDAQLKTAIEHQLPLPEDYTFPEILSEIKKDWHPNHKRGFTLFFTGLSGAGKSTIANAVMVQLQALSGRRVSLLDGDVVRLNLSSELTFSKEHRDLNILRIGFVASEITKHHGIAICAPIAPYQSTRRQIRDQINKLGSFIEVYVSTPIDVCEQRDRKGLYAKARSGALKGFTGIDDPYEAPENPEISIDTSQYSQQEAVELVLTYLRREHYLKP